MDKFAIFNVCRRVYVSMYGFVCKSINSWRKQLNHMYILQLR